MLESQSGEVFFSDDTGGSTAAVNVSAANEIKFGHTAAGAHQVGFLNLKDNAVSVLSASAGLQIDAGENPAQLQLLQANGSNFIALDVPATLGGDVVFTLPGTDGTANQALITDGSGNFSFKSFGSDSIRKGIFVINANLPAGNDLTVSGTPVHGDAITIDSVSADQGRALDVFVNRQLLVCGSAAARTAHPPTVDYEIAGVTPDSILKFSFDLEAEDVVQVVKRG